MWLCGTFHFFWVNSSNKITAFCFFQSKTYYNGSALSANETFFLCLKNLRKTCSAKRSEFQNYNTWKSWDRKSNMPCFLYTNVNLLLVVVITELVLAALSYFLFIFYHSYMYFIYGHQNIFGRWEYENPRLHSCEK